MREKFLNNRDIYIFLGILFIVLLYISFNIPLVADDFIYSFSRMTGLRLESIGDVLKSVGYEYLTWNGRLLAYLLEQLTMLRGGYFYLGFYFPS